MVEPAASGREGIKAARGNPALEVLKQSKASLVHLSMNVRHAALAKPGVREAIRWAMDYRASPQTSPRKPIMCTRLSCRWDLPAP